MRKALLSLISLMTCCALHVGAQSFEAASQAVSNMVIGWNLGNTLDANNGNRMTNVVQSETAWGQPVTKPELIHMMKEAGFGAIRVPVTWYPHMDDAGKVDEAWMKRVHEVVDYVIDEGLYCILNVHHDTGADSDGRTSWIKADETVYNNVEARYKNLWKQIAEEFKDYGDKLLFESYNEMLDVKNSWCFASFAAPGQYDSSIATSAYNAINKYAQAFVDVVRATGGNNAKRNLVVNTYAAASGGGTWNTHLKDPLKEMKYPNDPAGKGHIIFQVHSYISIVNDGGRSNRPLTSIQSEIDDMVNAWKTHLVSKGAPVILGEWGTSNVDAAVTDYDARRELMFRFCDYLIQKCNQNNVATFYWMGLSDGSYRSLPAFSQPDLAERIVKARRGSSFQGVYPTIDDYELTYKVTYNDQWSELNLYNSTISLSEYKGIRVELAEKPQQGDFQIKCYGEDGKEQYIALVTSSPTTTANFNQSTLGNTVSRITLQAMKAGLQTTVKRAFLIKKDNTEQELLSLTPFWGCSVEMTGVPLGIEAPAFADTPADDHIYNLQGQRVEAPTTPGIYIRGGKKFLYRGR